MMTPATRGSQLTRLRTALLLGIVLLWTLTTHAQQSPTPTPSTPNVTTGVVDASLRVDQETARLGEPVTITLTILVPEGIELVEEELPTLPDDETLQVLEVSELEVTQEENHTRYVQTITAVFWKTGEYLSPEIAVTYREGGTEQFAPLRSFYIVIQSQIPNLEEASPRPDAPPIDLPYTPRWVYWAVGGAAALVVLLLARLIQVGRRGIRSVTASTPSQIAIAQLEDMKTQSLEPAMVFTLVANQIRAYLQQQFGIEAIEMTSMEIIDTVKRSEQISRVQQTRLQQLLEQADLVKFARFQPDEAASLHLINFAIRWIQDVSQNSALSEGDADA